MVNNTPNVHLNTNNLKSKLQEVKRSEQQQKVMEKRKSRMNITFCNILLPMNFCRSDDMKRKNESYLILKNYVFNKLCIKELLRKVDEVDKLK